MSFLNKISQRYKVYPYGEASSENSIQNLKNFCAVSIPEEYFEIIREKEIEISIKDKDGYVGLGIWGADKGVELNQGYYIQKYIPDGIAIGDNGGGKALLYANGKKGFGLYLVDFGDLDKEELIYVSKSLKNLLLKEIGMDIFIDNY